MINEDAFKKNFGDTLSKLRKINGYTQLQLAEALNYSDKAVSKWERGESVPDTYTILKIAELLNVKPSYFFDEEASEISTPTIKLKKKNHPIKFFVPVISSIGVFFIASVLFLIFRLIPYTTAFATYIYLIALPVMFIELVVFAFIWWKRPAQLICTSCLIWSVGTTAYGLVQLFTNLYEFKYIFISCAILQVICLLVFLFLRIIKKNKTHFD